MTGTDILNLPMSKNDAGAATVRDYLRRLLEELWTEGEGFSGKRPFGNSGWEYDLYRAVVRGGAAPGTVDEHGDIMEIDTDAANVAVFTAISSSLPA